MCRSLALGMTADEPVDVGGPEERYGAEAGGAREEMPTIEGHGRICSTFPAMSDIAAYLAAQDIDYVRHDHPPVFTCEEEAKHVPESGAARTKNLFFRDRKGKRHLLLVTLCSKQVSIDAFAEVSGADRLSFASAERMMKYLGVEPGSVTVLGLINDPDHGVELFIDADVWTAPSIHAHPLRNDATFVLSHEALNKFLAVTGHTPRVVSVRS